MGLIKELRREIARIMDPEAKAGFNGIIGSEFNAWDSVAGKMRPTDFTAQINANQSWVYACVMAIAESVAMAQLKLYLNKGVKAVEIPEHVFLDVWTSVNPFMNNFELRELTEVQLLLTGNAYWYISKNALGVPAEIWNVPTQYMTVVPDKQKFISGYIYQPPGNDKVAFKADEIVHFKYSNPNNIFYGMGPLLAAAYAVDADNAMNKFTVNSFNNGGIPAALLTSDQVINKAEADRMREAWRQLYGGPDKAGKVAILSRGLKFQTISLTAQEMAYIQSKTVNRDTILGIFRVPKSILGLVEDVNRANAEATEYIFNLRNIKPKLIRFQEKVNEKIMPLYPQNGTNYLFVKFEDPVPLNRELLIKERESRLSTAMTTINQEREKEGMPPVEWGNVPILPLNVAPFGTAPEAPPETPPAPPAGQGPGEAEDEEEAAKHAKYFTRARVWGIFKARFDRETYRFNNIMKRLFNRQRAEVLDKLKAAYGKAINKQDHSDGFIFDVGFWEKEFAKTTRPEYETIYEAGVKHGKQLINATFDFNVQNPVAQRFLNDKIFRFSFETNATTRKQLKDELNEGINAGETFKDLAARVNKVFDFAENYRGMRIARTETADVENHSLLDVWSKSDKVEAKEWLHGGGGDNPRPEHVAMDGEVVDMGQRFSNGLAYPGDPAGGPEEVCNCTCSLLPVMKEAEE